MRAACRQYRAVGFKMSVPHNNDTITELPMKSLVVQLLEDLFKVSRKIHDPIERTKKESIKTLEKLKPKSEHRGCDEKRRGQPSLDFFFFF